MTVSRIDAAVELVTLVNVFSCEPEHQTELIDLLVAATEAVMRHRPGFISANIHAGLEGDHVVNYAQWATVQDFQQMLADPVCREHMAAALALATAAPVLCRVASVHHA